MHMHIHIYIIYFTLILGLTSMKLDCLLINYTYKFFKKRNKRKIVNRGIRINEYIKHRNQHVSQLDHTNNNKNK